MFETNADFFENLKRKRTLTRQKKIADNVFFQLAFDDVGAFLSVVDEKGREINTNYEFYDGHTRDLLKSIQNIQDRNSFRIDWDKTGDQIYLYEYEYLIYQIRYCANLVDEQFQPVTFAENPGKLLIVIEDSDNGLESKIVISHQGKRYSNIKLINENHAFVDGIIFQIQPLSENFQNLQHFETRLFEKNLEKYLSLLYSCFENIFVEFQKYKQIEGEPKRTQPALIFEKIDADNALYLRVSISLPGFDADFFDDYEVSRVALLNDLEKKIIVSEVLHEDIFACYNEISRLLRKHSKDVEERNEFFVEDNLFIVEENLARQFIHKELSTLVTQFTIFGAERLKSYKIRASQPTLEMSLSHGIDYLEGDVDLNFDGQMVSLFDALNQYQKNSYVQLNDGTHAIINRDYFNKLQRLFKKQQGQVRISFFDLPLVEELIDKKMAEESFPQTREVFFGFNSLDAENVEFPKVNATLRGYQEYGYKWIHYLHKNNLGGCLADDMGLGKTLQAITMLAKVYPAQEKSSLVIMPRSLLFNWASEIQKFRPELTFYTYHGTDRELAEALKCNVILTTYAMVRNDIEQFKEHEFHYIILDESQNIKNMNSQISRAVMLLHGDHRLALSGTPLENNLGELYSLFRFLNPAMFGAFEEFNSNYAMPIQRGDDKEALLELRKKIYPFILRRLKQDVLKDLPDKIEQTLYVEMSPKQKTFYDQRRMFYYQSIQMQIEKSGIKKSQFFILQALSELRQIASIPEAKTEHGIISPKREVLLENVLDAVANNHKVLVFANFLTALDCVATDLEENGIEYLHMTGATRDRQQLVETFQNEDTHKVFLMTLKTGGIGLNLTAADYIFIFDPWWNIAAENQAIDRTHRIGQDKTVFSYKLITKNTIEEKILQLQQKKKELFDNLIASDGASIKSLNAEDVEFVLGGGV